LLLDIVTDLGGWDMCSTAEVEIARRCAGIGAYCDRSESAMAAGDDVDLDKYLAAANAFRRLLTTLGLRRRPKPVPDLAEYIAARGGRQ
jgi:hypothetical protein